MDFNISSQEDNVSRSRAYDSGFQQYLLALDQALEGEEIGRTLSLLEEGWNIYPDRIQWEYYLMHSVFGSWQRRASILHRFFQEDIDSSSQVGHMQSLLLFFYHLDRKRLYEALDYAPYLLDIFPTESFYGEVIVKSVILLYTSLFMDIKPVVSRYIETSVMNQEPLFLSLFFLTGEETYLEQLSCLTWLSISDVEDKKILGYHSQCFFVPEEDIEIQLAYFFASSLKKSNRD